MGSLLHIVLAVVFQALVEGGMAIPGERPLAVLALCLVPPLLGVAVHRAFVKGRTARAEWLAVALHASPPLLHFVALSSCGWLTMVERTTGVRATLTGWPHPALFISFAPFLLFSLIEIESRARAYGSRGPALDASRALQVRMLLSGLLPLGLYVLVAWGIGSSPALRVGIEEIAIWNAAFAAGMLVLFSLSLPWILKRVWATRALPAGATRNTLESLAREARFQCSGILEWITGGQVANAAIVGLLPSQRVVLLSDALLARLTPRELSAVFAHEVGHSKRHHVLIFIAWALAFFLGADWVTRQWAPDDDLAAWLILLATVAVWYFGFGWLSRRYELEADLYSLQTVGDPSALVSALERVSGPHGHGRDSWRHFGTQRRVDFLWSAHENPARGERLSAQLKLFARAGMTLFGVVLLLQGMSLAASYGEDRVVADLRLGRYERALERAADFDSIDPELAGLLKRTASLLESATPPSRSVFEARGQSALSSGDAGAALEWLTLARLGGADDLAPVERAVRALIEPGGARGPAFVEALDDATGPWRQALEAYVDRMPVAR